jgi:hypothetical protein
VQTIKKRNHRPILGNNAIKLLGSLIILLGLGGTSATAQVVLSEIMFDAAGNENYDEFIEVFNLGPWPVDLAHWRISDGVGIDTIISIGEGTLLQVGQFGIILDGGYLENSTYYDSLIPDEALKLTIDNATFGSSGLSNSTPETVSLINPYGTVISSYTYTLGNDPGYSDEKVRLELGDDPFNWHDSERWNGTPGAPNSVQPDSLDLALIVMEFEPENPQNNDQIMVNVKAQNIGIQDIGSFTLYFGIDANYNRTLEPSESFGEITIQSLESRDTTWMAYPVPDLLPGLYSILAWADFEDDVDSNNVIDRSLGIGSQSGAVIINEILFNPLPDHGEWIELYNPGEGPVSLSGWRFADSRGIADTSRHMVLPQTPIWIDPFGYAILAEDSTIYEFDIPEGTPIEVGGNDWPSLNNSGDSLMLYDLSFQPIDSVFYQGAWSHAGNGVSLERISPTHASNDPLNWSDCVARDHATPGKENSVLFHPSGEEEILTCEPNPFSPDGDGRNDVLFIHFRLPIPTARVNVKIFDVRGRLVCWLLNNQPVGSAGEVIWDGAHGSGVKATIGMYIVYFEALNAASGMVKSAKRTVILAGKL